MQQRMASLGTAAAASRTGHSLHVPAAASAACCCSCHGPGPHRGPLHGGRRDAGPDQQPPHVVGGVAVVVARAPARAAACHGERSGLHQGMALASQAAEPDLTA